MNIDKLKETFKSHVENYDMKDNAILRKFYHSYRVMDYCMLLAKYNNFNENDVNIAMLSGLLHDYARFEQWTKYNTYSDINSIDHGDLAIKRLFEDNEILNYSLDVKYYDEIFDAIKYHNKYAIPSTLSEHNKLLCKIVRDADKLDIFYLVSVNKQLLLEDDKRITKETREAFYKNNSLSVKNIQGKNEHILLLLAMVYDLNFKYSFEYLKETKLIDKILDNIDNKILFKEYFEHINKYIIEKTSN